MRSFRVLSERDVERLLPMSLALEIIESVFRWHGQGEVDNRPRVRLKGEHGLLQVMPASVRPATAMGLKAYTTFRGEARFFVLLFSAETGELLAMIEAGRLGQIRTGAASGVATKYLARPDADVVGCYGTGYQATTQLEAVTGVRTIRRVQVYGRDAQRRARFAKEMTDRLGVEVVPVEQPQETARGASILITITSSKSPVLEGAWIEPGVHINAAGSNAIDRVELDVEAVRRAALIVTDSKEQAKIECGDLVAPIRDGVLNWDQVRELGEIVTGKSPGRTSGEAITLFESQGIAMEDVAVAKEIFEQASAHGVGQLISTGV